MVRLADLHPEEAQHMRNMGGRFASLELGADPFTPAPALRDAVIALITSAALHRRGDRPFRFGDQGYRLIPHDVDPADLVQTHVSVNFDRTHYQRDHNVVLPLDRLREFHARGEIGGISPWHYSVLGANPNPSHLRAAAADIAERLQADGVSVALLTPV